MLPPPKRDTFFFAHRLAAPADEAYAAHLDADALPQWWGGGAPVTVLDLDASVGGHLVYRLDGPSGRPVHGRLDFTALAPNERIVYRASVTTEAGTPVRPAGAPHWPLHLHTIVLFTPDGDDATVVSVQVSPADASDREAEAFRDARDHLTAGLQAAYRRLDRVLAATRSPHDG